MRQFASPGLRIWNLSREAKLVYTGFALFSLLALASTVAFYEDLVGVRGTRGVRAYYAGDGVEDKAPPIELPGGGGGGGGPKIDLPELPDEGSVAAVPPPLTVAVSYRKLLEVTHFHLFTVPVFLLIVAHLFMLTGLSSRAKMGWIAGGFGSSLLHVAAPWAVHYGGGAWAWLYAASGLAMAITSTVLTAYPVWAMWTGRPAPRPPEAPEGSDPPT